MADEERLEKINRNRAYMELKNEQTCLFSVNHLSLPYEWKASGQGKTCTNGL